MGKKGQPTKSVTLRYVGDEEHYVLGRPAVKGAEEVVDPETAIGLVESGLYEVVEGTPGVPEAAADGAAGGSEG